LCSDWVPFILSAVVLPSAERLLSAEEAIAAEVAAGSKDDVSGRERSSLLLWLLECAGEWIERSPSSTDPVMVH